MSKEDEIWYAKSRALYRIPGADTIEDYDRRVQDRKLAHYLDFSPRVDPFVVERKQSDYVKGPTIEEYIREVQPTSRFPKFSTEMPLLPP
jgi:hypothetical protein